MFRVHRVWSSLQPRRPHHPFVRALLGILAVGVLMVLLVVGAVIGVVLLAGSLLLRALRPARPFASPTQAPDAQVASVMAGQGDCIEGDYTVLRKPLRSVPDR
jgi:hypothetical protein